MHDEADLPGRWNRTCSAYCFDCAGYIPLFENPLHVSVSSKCGVMRGVAGSDGCSVRATEFSGGSTGSECSGDLDCAPLNPAGGGRTTTQRCKRRGKKFQPRQRASGPREMGTLRILVIY